MLVFAVAFVDMVPLHVYIVTVESDEAINLDASVTRGILVQRVKSLHSAPPALFSLVAWMYQPQI